MKKYLTSPTLRHQHFQNIPETKSPCLQDIAFSFYLIFNSNVFILNRDSSRPTITNLLSLLNANSEVVANHELAVATGLEVVENFQAVAESFPLVAAESFP